MAKAYKAGASYKFYLNTGSYGTPTWTLVKAVGAIAWKGGPNLIEISDRSGDDGVIPGNKRAEITFDLYEESGETAVETMIAAAAAGTQIEIAIANGAIATAGTKYVRMECYLADDSAADMSSAATHSMTAMLSKNSDYGMTRNTAA